VLGYRSDHRADVFAMGVLLYRVLTGQLPFSGDAATALYAVVYESPPRPSLIAPRVSLDVERVLALALAKSADHRIASAKELADALRRAMAGALPRELRQRADALVVAAPWGRAAPNHPTPQ
jgi:serine/threonine protein kinase